MTILNVLAEVGQRAERIINLLCDRVRFVNESAEISRYPLALFQLLLRFIRTFADSFITLSQMLQICLPAFLRCYRFFFYSFSAAADSSYSFLRCHRFVFQPFPGATDSSSTLSQLLQIRLPLFLSCCRFVFHSFSATANWFSALSQVLYICV